VNRDLSDLYDRGLIDPALPTDSNYNSTWKSVDRRLQPNQFAQPLQWGHQDSGVPPVRSRDPVRTTASEDSKIEIEGFRNY